MPTQHENQGGLLVVPGTNQCAGYIFNFEGHGAYQPIGKVETSPQEPTQAEIDVHNGLLAKAEIDHAIEAGKAVFYFSYERTSQPRIRDRYSYTNFKVSNWPGTWKSPHVYATKSFTPGFNCGERWHVYFTGPDGKDWYGINQGDKDCFRARRLKRQSK